jgi:NAD(P)-dependent dehydrogenase (short-subunit alcohol dehydrogenase family)
MGKRFDGMAAIVTGSSSGIGKATALRTAREGAAVCVVANRNVEGGEATAGEIERAGGRSIFVHADVGRWADCERIVAEAIGAFGRVDVLVNNAGITRWIATREMTEELWDRVISTNLKSVFMMTRFVLEDMVGRGRGSIVNVSSVHAEQTHGGCAVYAASKAGMCGLTRALALELAARGVRVNCVLPGTIDVTLYPRDNRPVDTGAWKPRPSDVQAMGRLGTPDEVAAVICFLASDDASFVNGSALVADGGLLCSLGDGFPPRIQPSPPSPGPPSPPA